jgi:hypothetical protein
LLGHFSIKFGPLGIASPSHRGIEKRCAEGKKQHTLCFFRCLGECILKCPGGRWGGHHCEQKASKFIKIRTELWHFSEFWFWCFPGKRAASECAGNRRPTRRPLPAVNVRRKTPQAAGLQPKVCQPRRRHFLVNAFAPIGFLFLCPTVRRLVLFDDLAHRTHRARRKQWATGPTGTTGPAGPTINGPNRDDLLPIQVTPKGEGDV